METPNILEDIDDIVGYLKGNESSFANLVRKYLRPIYNFVYRYVGNAQEAEDVVQVTFVKVWKNIKKFDQTRSFKTWIFNIAKNTAIDFLRKKKTIPFSDFEDDNGKNYLEDNLSDVTPLPPELFDQKDLSQHLTLAMQKLTPKYQVVLSLRYIEQLTFQEIAEVLGEPMNTVKNRCWRAVEMLRQHLIL
ncbi:MAG: hypothetical protein COU29_03130 [Candidatus Magasanikbacteria bacterium CG10_big_fil_rev_8_21_14_0_10_36_32]|uniref:RNA polymerase sigma factor n=1 Tax=Candidatus Magasanikbacteria bacterium CG10_big_fil_rev_8_21_14_0_10_36_32 TaxID=1974646 RepID=A0A2M6W629_9BACT|nr:MAG: hypothetical protein COU29_03130 [Candidatus Magasanikbacteria bacterium CG10_big_fil_rev_8_21_14_0_10_36_32]